MHLHSNICQERPGQKVRGTEILMFINDLLCAELLMQKVLQRADERLTVKCMNAERFLGERKREREGETKHSTGPMHYLSLKHTN